MNLQNHYLWCNGATVQRHNGLALFLLTLCLFALEPFDHRSFSEGGLRH